MSTVSKQKNEVPELRFGGFSDQWTETKLGKLGEIVNGLTYSPDNVHENGVLVLRSSNVQGRKLSFDDCVHVKVPAGGFNPVMENDILICVRNGSKNLIGKNALITKDAEGVAFGAFMSIFRSDSGKFLFQWFDSDSYKKQVHQNLGATINSINGADLRKFKLAVPNFEEQQKIADFLGSVDEWLNNLRHQKTALETYKRGMMQKLFTKQLRFKDDNGKDFPEWKSVRLSDLGDSYSGLADKSAEDFGTGQVYITYKQIFDNSVIDVSKFALVSIAPSERQNQAQRGDILFTTSSETPEEVGYASVLLGDATPYLNSFSFGFRPKSLNVLLPEYARYHFRSAPFRREVVKLAQGSTRYNISKVQFMKLVITLPSPSEQKKIADFLTALDESITAKADEISKAEQWKKGLMQKMFV